jgi:uncharacterized surface protein with fasciclin (FAS1) repeats
LSSYQIFIFVFVYAQLGLTTLSTVLKDAGLQLNTTGVTVFAPNDAAFADLSTTSPLVYKWLTNAAGVADLKSVLQLHVATSIVYSADIQVGATTVTTLNGEVHRTGIPLHSFTRLPASGFLHRCLCACVVQSLTINRSATDVTVGNANGAAAINTSGDEPASNGVAHVIPKVRTFLAISTTTMLITFLSFHAYQVLIPTGFTFNLGKALTALGLSSFAEYELLVLLPGVLRLSWLETPD